jgi:hypothetical protein
MSTSIPRPARNSSVASAPGSTVPGLRGFARNPRRTTVRLRVRRNTRRLADQVPARLRHPRSHPAGDPVQPGPQLGGKRRQVPEDPGSALERRGGDPERERASTPLGGLLATQMVAAHRRAPLRRSPGQRKRASKHPRRSSRYAPAPDTQSAGRRSFRDVSAELRA